MGVLNSFCRGVGNSPIKKIALGFCPGGWSGLELTDTYVALMAEAYQPDSPSPTGAKLSSSIFNASAGLLHHP